MSKIWKKLLMVILIVACLFNIVTKLVKRYSLNEELQSVAQYLEDKKEEEKSNNLVEE